LNDINYEKLENYKKLERLPPSAKLVFKSLEANGQMTQKEIIRETILPSRTVRYAINRLKEEEILRELFYFIDSRQRLYEIKRSTNKLPAE
jgi:transcription initiation factor IIE alpha subunit